jgi:formiminoglutamate deiminase
VTGDARAGALRRSAYRCRHAWLGGPEVSDDVLVEIEGDRITGVTVGVGATPPDARVLSGLVLPGLANCHSHAFHRALRGRTQRERGTFWTWRDQMYAVAGRLDPGSYFCLARATYTEMALAGITAVGEFHYVHHDPSGAPYAAPNAMGEALIAAAREVGIRIALLDTCYLAAGFDQPPSGVQIRFSDGSSEAWAARVESLAVEYASARDVVVGAAVHSVRAVPREQIPAVAKWADDRRAPLHVHLSEQVAENSACLHAVGVTPTRLLADAGVLGDRCSPVHATHLTDSDIALLGQSHTNVVLCPTTERDLADGIGPAVALHNAGCRLTLGSDSHAVIDLFEEMRALELHERLSTHERGHWPAGSLLTAGTAAGQRSLGFGDAGMIAVGARADLVALDIESVRTAGTGSGVETGVFAATSADVTDVVSGGVHIVEDREHVAFPHVGRDLEHAIRRVVDEP